MRCSGVSSSRGHHRQPVGEGVHRTVVALAETLHRRVGVERDDHRRAERARLREIGHVAAMQDVEAAVGEHQRARQRGDARRELFGGDDLGFESGGGGGHAWLRLR